MSTNRPDGKCDLPETDAEREARQQAAESERQLERDRIASWLTCEVFENRFDPDLSAYLRRLAAAVKQGVDPSVSLAEMAVGEIS